jgi:hypothetical protein
MNKTRRSNLIITIFMAISSSILFLIFSSFIHINIEGAILQTNPFWMPLEFDIGKGYFKANVFLNGVQKDTGLIKVCVTPESSSHNSCHYMNATEEEGQIIAPYVSVHAGIYVFRSSLVPPDSNVNVCASILKDQRTLCKSISNTAKGMEQIVDLNLTK